MSTKTLRPIWSDKHKEYMQRAVRATMSVAEGAVRAGKTVDNVAAMAYMLNRGVPDKFHLATGSTVANAKLNIGDCNGFGLEHIFRGRCRWTKYKDNEALVIRSHGREYVVIFAGGGKADSFKKIRGNSYGMWIATEINLHHESIIQEAFNRQLAAKVRKIFWDLNPSSPGNWIYTDYIDRFPESYGDAYNYEHFTIRDNATVSQERLAEIERNYPDHTSVWYRRDILGERCSPEGLVYDYKPEYTADEIPEADAGTKYYVSCDYGTMNPFSAGLWAVSGVKAVRIREYYYDGRNSRSTKTDEEYCDAVAALVEGYTVEDIIVDPSAASFITALRRRKFHVRQADNDVKNGIRRVASMLIGGNIRIHRSCTDCIREFGLYRWDDKATEDTVIKENDHAMDDVRYFANTIMKDAIRRGGSRYVSKWR